MTRGQLYEFADRGAENPFIRLIARWTMVATGPLVAAALTWGGSTLWALQQKLSEIDGKMQVQQAAMAGQIALLNSQIHIGMEDRYRSSDAKRDFEARDQRNNYQDQRLDRIEERMNRIERGSAVSGHQ